MKICCRAEVELFYKKGDGPDNLSSEGKSTATFCAESEDDAREQFLKAIQDYLAKRGYPRDRHVAARLYISSILVHDIGLCKVDALRPEVTNIAEELVKFAKEHPGASPSAFGDFLQARITAIKFSDYKKEHPVPVPNEQLTPLQRRMQSGGGGFGGEG